MVDEQEKRKVRFNIAIADYRPGQIVNYIGMPPGHKFWIDHEDILGATRICEFVNDLGLTESEMEAKDKADAAEAEALAKKEAEAKIENPDETKPVETEETTKSPETEFDLPLDADFQPVETGSDPDEPEWDEFIGYGDQGKNSDHGNATESDKPKPETQKKRKLGRPKKRKNETK
uniref:Uncharacterized protein n=1 Tax=viral metagenome TaxID=1070528 RepID=A0A6M3IXN5_9ZZZZ